ncbi:MAG: SOS response-associated peptidase [Sporichthyaceae bacterium]
MPRPGWQGRGVCGRYGASWGVDDLVEEFEVASLDLAEPLEPDYNVAPTKPVYAVVTRRGRDEPADADPTRRLTVLQWGLVPFWSKDPKGGARMINARIETAAEKPAFREAFAKRRCLLPADGYYEWYSNPEAKAPKQPFFIRARDGRPLAMAGLYEFWRDPTRERDDPLAWLRTCTVLTTTATDAVGHIHDRQPMFVPPQAWTQWLDPAAADRAALTDLLSRFPPAGLEAYPVTTAVNNHRNNGPELLEPLAAAEPRTLFG